jgi:phosphoribosylformimino-5-aminoimidazole carboxamide ribotide isomerase
LFGTRKRIVGIMQLWPAIDLRGGNCVRLRQGDYQQETVYGNSPADMARQWVDQGAECLHLVDLDGARDGQAVNRQAVIDILAATGIPCELGGGIRDEAVIVRWLEIGIVRLIVGTKALKEPDWFRAMCRKYPGKLCLGIDARNGFVATDGWLETSSTPAVELAKQFEDEPIAALIYTDIAKDGMLAGPNFDEMARMHQACKLPVVASGGVTTVEDIRRLSQLHIPAAILGRALYEGQLRLPDAIAASRE